MISRTQARKNNAQIRNILRHMREIGRDTAIATIADMFNLTGDLLKAELKAYGFTGNISHVSKWQANAKLIQSYVLEYQAIQYTPHVAPSLFKGVNRSNFAGFGQYV